MLVLARQRLVLVTEKRFIAEYFSSSFSSTKLTLFPTAPWSHLRVDFITELPSLDGNTCVHVSMLDSLSAADFSHLMVCPQLWKPLRSCLTTSSDITGFQKTLFQTVAHSLSPEYGGPSSCSKV